MKKTLLRKLIFCLWLSTFLSFLLTFSLAGAQVSLKPESFRKVEYTSQDLRDPFQSPFELFKPVEQLKEEAPVVGGLSHFNVQGMVWDVKTPQAIINNKVVKIGEVIGDAEILDIRKEGVYLLYQGRQYIIRPTISKLK